MTRKAISDEVQNSVLLKSRRRCCLCFWLEGIDNVVKGQIAHLDQNPENADEQNLVFLCYDHHDEYDSRTSTSKGLREGEVRKWRDELYREMEYRFRTVQSRALTIIFDETRHCFKEDNNQCEVRRIAVRNRGRTTIKNVVVKITNITAAPEEQKDELRKCVGLKLCLSVNPFGAYSHPDNPPESSVILHPGDEATFDFLRLCITPGNHLICHSNFFLNPQTSYLEQRPSGVISPGKYTVTIAAQGDDLDPAERQFEFSSSSKSVTFRPVENMF
jgi:hypothetical protein